jgi:hypothetical protein
MNEREEQTPELRKAVEKLWGDWNEATGGNYADCDDAFAFVQGVAAQLHATQVEVARLREGKKRQVAEWMLGLHTGMSSESIAARYLGVVRHYDHPYDSGDFGRCYRLLRICGISIDCMRGASPTWDRLVEAWPELERLYESMPTPASYPNDFEPAIRKLLNPEPPK